METSALLKVLKTYWGLDAFRPLQEDIINEILYGKNDIITLLPTGAGKSLCYQLPILCLPGICLVISPLIALMEDQVKALQDKGIGAEYINYSLESDQIAKILSLCTQEKVKLLYISPERLESDLFQKQLATMQIAYVVVDEAHCISDWGNDFRHAYRKIAITRKIFPEQKIIALSASATQQVIAEIIKNLEFRHYKIFKQSFARKNIFYGAIKCDDKYQKLSQLLASEDQSSIVYASERIEVMKLYLFLNSLKLKVCFYHGGLNSEERSANQTAWMENKKTIIVATNAFGMGIDKPNVRNIIHFGLPRTIEAYYQEAGRAGRDGKPSKAIILFEKADVDELYIKHDLTFPPKKIKQKLLKSIILYLQTQKHYPLDFDYICFSISYDFPIKNVFSILKDLQNDKKIILSHDFFNFSSVKFTISPEEMKLLWLNFTDLNVLLLKELVRIYSSNLFFVSTPIFEKELANSLQKSVETISNSLKDLHTKKVIVYNYKARNGQILEVFFGEPISKYIFKHLNLSDIKAQASLKKIKQVIYYASCDYRCRTQVVLDYFGEISDTNCNNCDYCFEKKSKSINSILFDDLSLRPFSFFYDEKLKPFLYNSPKSQEDIINFLSEIHITKWQTLQIIDYLLYSNKLTVITNNLYVVQ